MGCFAALALSLALWVGSTPAAYLVPTEVYVNSSSSEEDKPAVLTFARSILRVVESSHLLNVVESSIISPPGTFEIRLDLMVGDGKVLTSWEVWVMDDLMRRQQLWRSGISFTEVDADTLVWKGNAFVTKQTIRVVQAVEQVELNIREKLKIFSKQHTRTLDL